MEAEKHHIQSVLDDDQFIQWICFPNDQLDTFCNDLKRTDPQKHAAVIYLRSILQHLKVDEPLLTSEVRDQIWQSIQRANAQRKLHHMHIWRKAGVAATIMFAILTGSYVAWRHWDFPPAVDYTALLQQSPADLGKSVQLVTGGNKVVDIVEKNAEIVYNHKGEVNLPANVSKSVPDTIKSDRSATTITPHMHQLIVPYGCTSNIILSDGSKIWVNSGSRIIYPSVFADATREIFVSGEVYLDVTYQENIPFVVKTSLLEIRVLGTGFNVSAYADDAQQQIVLVSGGVRVTDNRTSATVQLYPNQLYNYEVSSGKNSVDTVDIFDYICWKYGFFNYQSQTITTVMKHLEKYYNIHIDFDEQALSGIIVSGKLDLKQAINEVMSTIAVSANLKYEIRDRKIVVTLK